MRVACTLRIPRCRQNSKRNVKSAITCKSLLLSNARKAVREDLSAFKTEVQAAGQNGEAIEEGFFDELLSGLDTLAMPAPTAKEHTARMEAYLVALTSKAPVVRRSRMMRFNACMLSSPIHLIRMQT